MRRLRSSSRSLNFCRQACNSGESSKWGFRIARHCCGVSRRWSRADSRRCAQRSRAAAAAAARWPRIRARRAAAPRWVATCSRPLRRRRARRRRVLQSAAAVVRGLPQRRRREGTASAQAHSHTAHRLSPVLISHRYCLCEGCRARAWVIASVLQHASPQLRPSAQSVLVGPEITVVASVIILTIAANRSSVSLERLKSQNRFSQRILTPPCPKSMAYRRPQLPRRKIPPSSTPARALRSSTTRRAADGRRPSTANCSRRCGRPSRRCQRPRRAPRDAVSRATPKCASETARARRSCGRSDRVWSGRSIRRSSRARWGGSCSPSTSCYAIRSSWGYCT